MAEGRMRGIEETLSFLFLLMQILRELRVSTTLLVGKTGPTILASIANLKVQKANGELKRRGTFCTFCRCRRDTDRCVQLSPAD